MTKRENLLLDMLAGLLARALGFSYHTKTKEKVRVYHFHPECPAGVRILPKDIRAGEGRRREPCSDCGDRPRTTNLPPLTGG